MSLQQPVNVGIVGAGLMGREVATAIARWSALVDYPIRPRLVAVCDVDSHALNFFDQFDTVRTRVTDYRDLLADAGVDVVYVAVRHDLHEQIYADTIRAGKDLFAEKPFGIDLAAAVRILEALRNHPRIFARCSSEMPFFPGAQYIVRSVLAGEFGPLIEATCGFSHSSDFDRSKPITWKRQRRYCGDAGVMNDLGMHVAHLPLRFGWTPATVFGVLQNLVPIRPDANGVMVECDTYENATLMCNVKVGAGPDFPLMLSMKRIDPGQKNSWTFRVSGLEGAAEFSTRYPKTVRRMDVYRGEQVWSEIEMGSQSVFPTVTGPIFEAGFSDVVLQMWAAYLAERAGVLGDRFGCVTPAEAAESHRIWDAAMRSASSGRAEAP